MIQVVQLPARSASSVALGLATGAVGVGLVVAALVPFREDLSQAAPALALVVPVVLAGVVGRTAAAIAIGVLATLALDVAFIPHYGSPAVAVAEDSIALVVFLLVAGSIGALVGRRVDRLATAERRSAELEQLNAELAAVTEEREQLAEEANRLKVLEQIDAQRSALLRSVSHDLRTPLATIRAVTSDLADGSAGYDEDTRLELVTLVSDEAERLDRLVSNLLSMSRIEAGAFAPERQAVDLDELVRERVGKLAPMFTDVRLIVDVPSDLPLVDGDYTQLEQVLTNLLENAARHAPMRSSVTVSGRARPDGQVEVSVADEGIGVADYERARIFRPFARGEGSRSSGIGLAICRAVVEAHGGRIDVFRTEGGGATFTFTLPAREQQP